MGMESAEQTPAVLGQVYDRLIGCVGEAFFAALLTELAQAARADYAFVGEFSPTDRTMIQTEAVYAEGQIIDNILFPLQNTPCDAVLREGLCYYPRDVIKLFPLDHLAIQMEVDSYIGIPLVNSHGQVMGPLAVFSRKPLENIGLIKTAMRMFALRAAAELERLKIERQRQEELHFLQSLLDALPNPTFYKDTAGRYLGCNEGYARLIGRRRDEILCCQARELHASERAEVAAREDARVFASGQPRTYESTLDCNDGSRRRVLFNKAPFFDRQGQLAGLVGTIQDITRLKQMEAAIQTLVEGTLGYTGSACYRRVAEQLCSWFDADCAIVGCLRSSGQIHSLATRQDGVLLGEYDFDPTNTPCQHVMREGMFMVSEGLLQRFPHTPLVVNLQAQGYVGAPVRGRDGKVIGVLSVLSRKRIETLERAEDVLAIMAARVSAEIERERSEQQLQENRNHLEYLVYHDALTELPNRQLFRDRLQHAISMARLAQHRVGVLFLDIDRFKKINDSLGHETGDRVLCEVSRRLLLCARDADTVARLSGDEFALIIDQIVHDENVILVAQEVSRALALPIEVDDFRLFVTASIGISMYPQDGRDVVSLLKAADAAMFQAKELGRDTYRFYTPGLNERASTLLLMEGALRQAVDQNNLVVYYQPQVELTSGRVVGVEALLRWRHPQQGMISPAEFIPLAEETGLIVSIGEWALLQACRQGCLWHQTGYAPLRVAVNISARQFRQSDLVAMVRRVLRETGFDGRHLELELTESLLMDDVDGAIATMTQLSQLGVRLSIDDFGTGYSSLAYLKRFPINYLKIDRSFVRDIMDDPNDAAIAATIIDLARNMNLHVIAEGIELEAQRVFLQQKGCRYGQGYLFSQPLPADQLTLLLARQPAERP
ncbi:EAL domain-containing protein [Desulfuromonas thiophila]|uniref:putative bifunctional diguanylate cyclase/phosphodiesterase n=1 Tax=Desulfuromonas thiophila TaxID=57664 RepID=UPI0029F526CE|nr:EAL domain-containing protein [Desulfuromonas thiophila]